MGILNTERFVDIYTQEDSPLRRQLANTSGNMLARGINREAAMQTYDNIRSYLVSNGYFNGKILRPWDIDTQLYSTLDRSEPWWGFEFETGYRSREARGEIVGEVYDRFENVCFDAEGEGTAPVEITFYPQEVSKFVDKSAQAYQFMQLLEQNRSKVSRTQAEHIGTHINVSHPGVTEDNKGTVARMLNLTVAYLPVNDYGVGNVREYMFGRASIYGGFSQHTASVGGNIWYEGKLFRTCYDMETFDRYVKVCHALTAAMSKIIEALDDAGTEWQRLLKYVPFVDNLYQVAFEDAEPRLQWVSADVAITCGSSIVNGNQYGSDNWTNPTPQTEEAMREKVEAARREAERAAREEAAKEVRRSAAFERLLDRRRMYITTTDRPEYVAEDAEWCVSCHDWHYTGADDELFTDPDYLFSRDETPEMAEVIQQLAEVERLRHPEDVEQTQAA